MSGEKQDSPAAGGTTDSNPPPEPPEGSTVTKKRREIVISGMSCRLPLAENVTEFKYNLRQGIDMSGGGGERIAFCTSHILLAVL